jgi:Outer membrane protein beta-barrel domain
MPLAISCTEMHCLAAIAVPNFQEGVSIMFNFKPSLTAGVILLVTLIADISASAQSDVSKFEAGVQVSMLGRGSNVFSDTIGGGGRLTFNFNRYLALEGEMNYFPATGVEKFRKLQGQFGIKSGIRFNRFGVFGKARPGFQKSEYESGLFCNPPICQLSGPSGRASGFSMDVGGVLEFYPTKRIIVRFDAGDTIFTGVENILFLGTDSTPPFSSRVRYTLNTFQLSTGIGIRF